MVASCRITGSLPCYAVVPVPTAWGWDLPSCAICCAVLAGASPYPARPLHQRLYNQPLTGFRWLDKKGEVQQSEFADGTRLIANFGPVTELAGITLAAQSVLALLPDGKQLQFVSQADGAR